MDQVLAIKKGVNLRVLQKIVEGKKERVVSFKGTVTNVRGLGENKMITVRQLMDGVSVEKIFPVALPTIVKIEVEEQKKKVRQEGKHSSSVKT
jgi:large subunit ribosomal protein L19